MNNEISNEIKGEMRIELKGDAGSGEKANETEVSSVQCSVFSQGEETKLENVRPHLFPMASQARHKSVAPQETCASRNVVPQEKVGVSDSRAGIGVSEKDSVAGLSGVAAAPTFSGQAGPADTGALRDEKNEPPHVGCYGVQKKKKIGTVRFRAFQRPIFMDHKSGIVVLHWSRQVGKSYALAAWAVYRLLDKPGRLVTVLSNSRENGAEFLNKCVEICALNDMPIGEVVRSSPKLDYEDMRLELRIRVEGKLGRIKVLAANPRTARGFSGDLILDEFASHEDADAIWEAAEPILAANKDFLCRIASTGNGKHNLFYRMVEGEDGGSRRGWRRN